MKRPNFFIIGAPKSGTTALSEYLRTHPRIFFSDPKEPNYFSDDLNGRLMHSEAAYQALFTAADPERHLAVGEGSTCYLYSTVAIRRILDFSPEARLIVMVRNPVDLVRSWHAQLLFSGEEDIPDFEQAWRAESARKVGKCVPPGCRGPEWLYYSEWGRLGSQLDRAFRSVDRERMLVVVFDDFVRDSAAVYRQVLGFLGLPDDGRAEFPVVNERRRVKSPSMQRMLALGEKAAAPIRRALGRNRGFGIRSRLLMWNSVPEKANGMRPEFRDELCRKFAGDVDLLSRLIGRDLSRWCG